MHLTTKNTSSHIVLLQAANYCSKYAEKALQKKLLFFSFILHYNYIQQSNSSICKGHFSEFTCPSAAMEMISRFLKFLQIRKGSITIKYREEKKWRLKWRKQIYNEEWQWFLAIRTQISFFTSWILQHHLSARVPYMCIVITWQQAEEQVARGSIIRLDHIKVGKSVM